VNRVHGPLTTLTHSDRHIGGEGCLENGGRLETTENERDRDIAGLIASCLESDLLLERRLAAIEALIEKSAEIAKPVMLAVAERTTERRLVLEAVGVGLARIEQRGVRVSEFDLRNVSEVAFLAYDGWTPT